MGEGPPAPFNRFTADAEVTAAVRAICPALVTVTEVSTEGVTISIPESGQSEVSPYCITSVFFTVPRTDNMKFHNVAFSSYLPFAFGISKGCHLQLCVLEDLRTLTGNVEVPLRAATETSPMLLNEAVTKSDDECPVADPNVTFANIGVHVVCSGPFRCHKVTLNGSHSERVL